MKEYLKEIKYSEIKKINGNSKWKTDRIIEHYTPTHHIIEVLSMNPEDPFYVVNLLTKENLKYRARDFEIPIGKREWIAWGFLLFSIIANVAISFFK